MRLRTRLVRARSTEASRASAISVALGIAARVPIVVARSEGIMLRIAISIAVRGALFDRLDAVGVCRMVNNRLHVLSSMRRHCSSSRPMLQSALNDDPTCVAERSMT